MRNLTRIVLAASVVCAAGLAPLPGLLESPSAPPASTETKSAVVPKVSSQVAGFASLPAAAQSAISAAIDRDQSAYQAQPRSNGGFGMVNSEERLTAEFAQSGVAVRVGDRKAGGWDLALEGYGRAKSMNLVSSVAPQANANRVEYHHGGLTEWYVNSPAGLEQGFKLARPPKRSSGQAGQPLTIALKLSGDLTASLDSAGNGLTLKQHNGQAVLRYAGLSAQDYTGEALKCSINLQGSQLLLRVNDAGARYPIVVDPWIQATQLAELTNSSGVVSDDLGHSVAVSGNTVVVGAVGANKSQGAVYVFVEPATGWATTPPPTAVLTVPVAAAIQQVGYSVAISRDGSTIVTGAPSATIATPAGSNQFEGAAYVFAKPASGWATTSTPTAELNASDGTASQNFGYSVGVNESGNTIVVGSIGPAYVFNEPMTAGATSWSEAISPQDQTAELINPGSGFSQVAISGNTVVGFGSFGSNADVFVGPAFPSLWPTMSTPTAVLTPSSGTLSGPVAISGSTVVVGANVSPAAADSSVGAAYVFVAPGGAWTDENQNAVLTSSSANSICYDFFGASASINETGDTIVVGAYGAGVLYNSNCMIPPTPATSQQGAAFVFAEPTTNGSTAWTNENETQKLTSSDAANGDLLGYSVGISGNTVVAGAPSKTIGSNPFQGAAYVFGQPVSTTPLTVTVTGTQVYGGTGESFTPSYSGFVNGDTSSVVTGTLTCDTNATSSSPGGSSYTISNCSGLSAANYTISYSYGPFTVTPAPLAVTVTGAQVYGGTGKSFTVTGYSGFVNGDTPSVVTGTLTCSTSATTSSPVGSSYTSSSCSGLSATNYVISYVYETFSVIAAPLTVVVTGTQVYGGTGKSITVTGYSGFVNGDTPSVVTGTLTCSTSASSSSPVGNYAISSCSGLTAANYTIGYAYGLFRINPAPLTITASSSSTPSGTPIPAVTPIYGGFVNGDTAASLTTQPTCVTKGVSATSPPGTYAGANTCSGAVDSNYAIGYVPGNVVITSTSATYTIGGTLTGLSRDTSVTLLDDGGNALTLTADGKFIFTTALASGASYDVTVSTQPASEVCDITRASGKVATTNVTTVLVSCRPKDEGYWLVTADGGLFSFGDAGFYGSIGGVHLSAPIVGMQSTPDGKGYWMVASDGGLFSFGDARSYGSIGGVHLSAPIVGMQSTPDGKGYWMVASDGGLFSFGDAGFYGSIGGVHLSAPIVGMQSTPDGKGYWMIASDGGLFSFGDAKSYGSIGGVHLSAPIVGMQSTPDGKGYWMVASDGGLFSFGDAKFYGSIGGVHPTSPVVGMAATYTGKGYWLVTADGGVFPFGDAKFYGALRGRLDSHIVGMSPTL